MTTVTMTEPPVADITEKEDVSFDFTDTTYSRKFLGDLTELLTAGDFSDVTVCSGDLHVPCHKVILSAASPFFRAMFTSGMQESQSGQVDLRDIEPKTLTAIISYIYGAKIKITTKNVQNLIQACEVLQFDSLRTACEEFVIAQTSPVNCIGFYQFARLFSLKKLMACSRLDMLTKFKEVVKGQEFLQLSADDLIEYISDDALEVPTEDTVFDAVKLWTNHDIESRKDNFEKVVCHVRLPFCSSIFLCHEVKSSELMTSQLCQTYLEEARMFHMIPDRQHEMHSLRTVPRFRFNLKRHLVLVGGLTSDNEESGCCWYLKEDGPSWELLAKLPKPKRKFFSVCAVPCGILITGGYHGNNKKDCWLFDTREKRWNMMPPLLIGRCKHASLVHAGKVYILGGEDDQDKRLKTVEVLDLRKRQWSTAPSMPKGLSDPVCISHGRHIFVFGGIEDEMMTSRMTMMFDPVWGEWSLRAEMTEPCRLGATISINDAIYVVGGYTRSCLKYNPNSDTWQVLEGRPREKHGNAPAVAWQGKILVAGGDASSSVSTRLIEMYEPDTDQWSYWSISLREELSCHHIVNVDLYGI